MKKIITIASLAVLSLGVITNVSAQSSNANSNANGNDKGQKVNVGMPLSVAQSRIQKVSEIAEKVRLEKSDPEAALMLENIQAEQENVEAKLDESLSNVESRSGFMKFLLGPDYKNAGEVRSEVVRLRNQVAQLTRLRENMPDEAQPEIDQAINSLNAETNIIQTRLNSALEGFSLFGWLNRFLAGFAPVEDILPMPTPIGTDTPEVSPLPVGN